MNAWLWGATALLAAFLPCLAVSLRGSKGSAVVALQLAGVLGPTALLLLAEGFGREPLADLALVLAVLSFCGSAMFARYLERAREQ